LISTGVNNVVRPTINKLSTMLFQAVTVEQCCNNMLTILFIVGRTTLFAPVDTNLEQVVDFLNFYACRQGRREVGGGPWQIFLRGPYLSGEQPPPPPPSPSGEYVAITRVKNVSQSARLFTFCVLDQSECLKFEIYKQKE
jgi:hypothetical protein